MKPFYERDGITIYVGDNRDVLPHIEPVHAVVTDPPYGLTQTKRNVPAPTNDSPYNRHRVGVNGDVKPVGGFMGKQWDGTGVERDPELWRAISDAMLPGAHLLAFGGTRTYHRIAVAIEDAGYEIRDTLQWLYGSGFPKSHDVSKAIDRMAGAEREVVGRNEYAARRPNPMAGTTYGYNAQGYDISANLDITAPATPEAEQWQGWGTALKPAYEPIIMARLPFKGTVAANVLAHGTGAINVDACRIAGEQAKPGGIQNPKIGTAAYGDYQGGIERTTGDGASHSAGRWPANVILDEDAAAVLDAQSGVRPAGGHVNRSDSRNVCGDVQFAGGKGYALPGVNTYSDTGGASRFFYVAKASRRERNAGLDGMPERGRTLGHKRCAKCGKQKVNVPGSACVCDTPEWVAVEDYAPRANHHPTVKPLALMRYLIQMVTPPGGVVLDPFAGSGSTLVAAAELGFDAIGIELSEEYAEIAARRVDHVLNERAKRLPGLEVAD